MQVSGDHTCDLATLKNGEQDLCIDAAIACQTRGWKPFVPVRAFRHVPGDSIKSVRDFAAGILPSKHRSVYQIQLNVLLGTIESEAA